MSILKDKIADLLVQNGFLTQKGLEKGLQIQENKGGKLGQILVDNNLIKEEDLLVCLSQQLNIPRADLSHCDITPSLLESVPFDLAEKYRIIPISKTDNAITVAMADPLNLFIFDDLKIATNCEIKAAIAAPSEISAAIEKYYKSEEKEKENIEEVIQEAEEDVEIIKDTEENIKKISESSKQAPIIKMVNFIIAQGFKNRASDIHLEPYEDKLRIRYRIDGRLQEKIKIPKQTQSAILARLKIMSNLDITEHRLPQDG
ncbi:MAG: Flp pilus assembly complex ATPase component TadA, partial [Candidatus Omnitrophica bacterium]|nr:Flp pilus assembly complex ATPase component TadA [Candidatus Omnitrophota bacterium]